jgi:hypothetical protein
MRGRLEKLRGRIPDSPQKDPASPNLIDLCQEFSREVTRALRELLETKHLYQRVKAPDENLHGANKTATLFRKIAELSEAGAV